MVSIPCLNQHLDSALTQSHAHTHTHLTSDISCSLPFFKSSSHFLPVCIIHKHVHAYAYTAVASTNHHTKSPSSQGLMLACQFNPLGYYLPKKCRLTPIMQKLSSVVLGQPLLFLMRKNSKPQKIKLLFKPNKMGNTFVHRKL